MVKKLSSKQYPLKKLFSSEFEYIIPYYQRPYAWSVDQSSALFDDLYDFYMQRNRKLDGKEEDLYFLGSIVLIKDDFKPMSQVVDGQQRLTTLTILLAAIASKLTGEARTDFHTYVMEKARLSQEIEAKPRLSFPKKDQIFFRKYVQELDFPSLLNLKLIDREIDSETKRNIRLNSEILQNNLQDKFKDDPEKILSFGKFLVQDCYLVAVTTPDQHSAFRVFSILNDRGLNLLATDKLKADIIGKIEPEDTQEYYAYEWEYLENEIGRDEFLELFGHIRMIFAKKKAKQTLFIELNEYVPLNSPKQFIDEKLRPLADAFKFAKGEYISGQDSEVKELLNCLNRINNSDWLPPAIYFLAWYKNQPENSVNFFSKLERLAAYLHICGKNVNYRIARYADLINSLEKEIAILDIQSLKLSDDEIDEMKKILDGPIYEELPAHCRNYLILRLDSFLSDTGATYDSRKLTIEHVLPQNVAETSEWSKSWSEDERKYWVHRLANLVPLSKQRNFSAQNFDFEKKKTKYFAVNGGVPIYGLTTQILKMDSWTPSDVEKRQKELLGLIYKKWEL